MLFKLSLKIIIGFLLAYQILAYPSTKDVVLKRYKLEENPDLFEGDMRFPDLSQRGVLRRGDSVAWTNGIVPYEIRSHYDSIDRSIIQSTMQKMERLIAINNVQCIHFRPRISSDQYYITIENGLGCSSYVGQNLGHIVTLESPGCITEGIIMHELLHTLGFYHEQSRPDRDTYITVNYTNIEPGMEYSFEKYDSTAVDIQNTPYDYASVMHYDQYGFSLNGYPTITPKQSDAKIGQRYNMSAIDIQEVRLFYNCSSIGSTFSPISTTTTTGRLRRVNTTISSSLRSNSSVYNRDGRFDQYYYESYEIRVPIDDYYILMSKSSIDTYGYLYQMSFNPYNPYSNLIAYDDDAGGSRQFQLTKYLVTNRTYILVLTTYSSLVTGNYQLIVEGANLVQLIKLLSVSMTTTRTTTTGIRRNTTISSSLRSNSSVYNRMGTNNQCHYYEAYEIWVPIDGYYILTSKSSIDTYGYLYQTSFNPYNPYSNLIAYNDDAGGSRQFQLTEYLVTYRTYILVLTTYLPMITGHYQLIVEGANRVQITELYSASTLCARTTTRRTTTSSSAKQSNHFGTILLLVFQLLLFIDNQLGLTKLDFTFGKDILFQ